MLNAAIDSPDEMAPTAPRVISVQIPVDKIGELIGPKGKTINGIQDGTPGPTSRSRTTAPCTSARTDGPTAEAARRQINAIANPSNPEVGERFLGTVVKIIPFGAFISLTPGKDGLLHVTQIAQAQRRQARRRHRRRPAVGQKIQVGSPRSTIAASSRSSRSSRSRRKKPLRRSKAAPAIRRRIQGSVLGFPVREAGNRALPLYGDA